MLWVKHRFAVASSPRSNGTCERIVREVVSVSKIILQEERRDIREWVDAAVQWALNTSIARDAQAHRTASCSGRRHRQVS